MFCFHCNKEYIQINSKQKYCSSDCQIKAKWKRQNDRREYRKETVCEECKEIFVAKFFGVKLCSKICVAKHNSRIQKVFLDIPQCLSDASRKLDKCLGYVRLYAPMHPEANSWGYVYEHRLIAEQSIGRRLLPNEIVHHKNGKRWDNRPENLEVMDKNDHAKLHGQRDEDLLI